MKVHPLVQKKLKNGMRLHFIPVDDTKDVAAHISFNTGMQYFTAAEQHVPHLIEHLLLSDAEGQDINEELGQSGANANAETDSETLSVSITTPARFAAATLGTVLGSVFSPDFDQEAFETERAIVLREVHERFDGIDSQTTNYLMHKAYDTIFPEAWHEHLTNIQAITYDRVAETYREQICPENATVIVAGPRELLVSKEFIKLFESVKPHGDFRPLKMTKTSPGKPGIEPVMLDLGGSVLFTSFYVSPLLTDEKKRTAASAATILLFAGPTAIIDKKLRKLGAVYSTANDMTSIKSSALFFASAMIDKAQAHTAVIELLRAVQLAASGYISDAQVNAARNYGLAVMDRAFETIEDVLSWFAGDILTNRKVVLPAEETKRLEHLTKKDIAAAAKDIFMDSKMYGAIVSHDSPFWVEDMTKKLPDIAKLTAEQEINDAYDALQLEIAAKRAVAPERVGYHWAAFYGLSFVVLLLLIFASVGYVGGKSIQPFSYAFDHFGQSLPLMVLIILQVLAAATGWVSGKYEWLAERIGIFIHAAAAVMYGVTFGRFFGGFSRLVDGTFGGWLLWLPTIFFFVFVPLAFLSVALLSLQDRFRRI